MKPKIPRFRITGSSIVNVLGALAIVYLAIVLGQTVKRNYDLGRQIDQLRAQISTLQSQKEQLAYSIQYYNTDSFRDREARSKLGLQLPGENAVIVPHKSPTPKPAPADTAKQTGPKSNLQQWFDFFAGRS